MMATAIFSYNNVQTDRPARQPKPHRRKKKQTGKTNQLSENFFPFLKPRSSLSSTGPTKGLGKKKSLEERKKKRKEIKGKKEKLFI